MSRENAIKFLHEISLGIEYLENSYANRGQNDQSTETVRRVILFCLICVCWNFDTFCYYRKRWLLSNRQHRKQSKHHLHRKRPIIYHRWRKLMKFPMIKAKVSESQRLRRQFVNKMNFFFWIIQNSDYDESTGRLRIADFLYAEYSLEEVIYQLAKVTITDVHRQTDINRRLHVFRRLCSLNPWLGAQNKRKQLCRGLLASWNQRGCMEEYHQLCRKKC